MDGNEQGELFDENDSAAKQRTFTDADITALAGLYSDSGVDVSSLPPDSLRLYGLSRNAFSAVVHARMSELSVYGETARFVRRILAAADSAGRAANAAAAAVRGRTEAAMRRAAEIAAEDSGDSDARAVYGAARKVGHEISRLMGFLRFAPGEDGVYVAVCAPDHFVLPALGEHFKKRFGGAPWGIIDAKRRIRLSYVPGRPFVLSAVREIRKASGNGRAGEWESIWRDYNKAACNDDRINRDLQDKFVPQRYREHMTEM